jgi:hypothetical protein
MTIETFAAARKARLVDFNDEIRPIVEKALGDYGSSGWYEPIVEGAGVLWSEIFERESPTGDAEKALAGFLDDLRASLAKTSEPDQPPTDGQIDRVVNWVGVYSVNSATYHAGLDSEQVTKTWITMLDDKVRATHRVLHGQSVPIGDTFDMGGAHLSFPGEPVGSPENYLNCRCVLSISGGPEMGTKTTSFAATAEEDLDEERELTDEELESEDLVDGQAEIPWHGVLVVEGVPTGDKRQFDEGSLSYGELPLPITFQRSSDEGHKGSVVVGRIDEIWKEEGSNEHRARGMLNLNVPEANEVVDGLVFGMFGGVSVDVDSNEFYLEFEEDEEGDDEDIDLMGLMFGGGVKLTHFTAGRIRSASIVQIPAFAEAYVALGSDFDEELRDPQAGVDGEAPGEDAVDTEYEVLEEIEMTPEQEAVFARLFEGLERSDAPLVASAYDEFRDFPAEERKKSADKGHALPDGSFPIENVDDLKNAIQAIGRAKDPDKAKAHIKKRARDLGQEDLIPEDWAGISITAAAFAPGTHDGPGWLTHPRATQRLRSYWVHGKGAAKIRWLQPGDFNRCRRQLAKYVNPAFLSGTCANLHREATGLWPGRERGDKHSLEAAPAFALVASAAAVSEAARFFENPQFDKLTPLTVEGDGRVYGHLAAWGTCHIGIGDACVMPPSSESSYAFFATGQVLTENGFVNTGRLILGTGHAEIQDLKRHGFLSLEQAARHYDDTGRAVADVAVGEDGLGIWFSGKVRDSASAEDVKALRASALSGDWRRSTRGGLELIAALAVNVAGMPMPRFAMDGERQVVLLASAGMLAPRAARKALTAAAYVDDADTLLAIGRVVADEIEYRQERRARLSTIRDPELLEAASARRAERLAAARILEE